MINSVIDYLGVFEPLFLFLDVYFFVGVVLLFIYLAIKSGNYLGFVVAAEFATNNALFYVLGDSALLQVSIQFSIMGFATFFISKNALLLISYLALLFLFFVQHVTNSAFELDKTNLANENNAWIAYYSYYLFIGPILFLMGRGLFTGWGKGNAASGIYDIAHRNDDVNNNLFISRYSRFKNSIKRLLKKSNKGVL